jgi:outer membrane protein TolC
MDRRHVPIVRSLLLAAVAAITLSAPFAAAQSTPTYSLADCVRLALDTSPTLAQAEENMFIANKGVTRAWGAFLPSLSGSYTWNKSERTDFDYELRNPTTGAVIGLTDLETSYKDKRYALNAGLNLFDGFNKFGGLKTARNELKASEMDLGYSRQQVIETVATTYINLLRNERLLEVSVEARDLAAKELEKAETYHRIGSAAKSDVLQAKVRLEQTRLDEVRARNNVEQSFAELAHAMNRPLIERFDVDRSMLDRDYQVMGLEALFEEALAERQDLKSRAFTLEARGGDVQSATSGLLPSVDLFASYSRSENESEFRFGSQESDAKSYGIQVQWNIFDRFATLAGRSQANARKRIAEYNLQQAELDAQLEVRRTYNTVIEARERITLTRETIANAEEELRLAQERFRVGAGTMLDKITAQVNLATARGDEVQARSDFTIATLQLDRSVGRALDALME